MDAFENANTQMLSLLMLFKYAYYENDGNTVTCEMGKKEWKMTKYMSVLLDILQKTWT